MQGRQSGSQAAMRRAVTQPEWIVCGLMNCLIDGWADCLRVGCVCGLMMDYMWIDDGLRVDLGGFVQSPQKFQTFSPKPPLKTPNLYQV